MIVEEFYKERPGNNLTDPAYAHRLEAHREGITSLYNEVYRYHPRSKDCFERLLLTLKKAHEQRSASLRERDRKKIEQGNWFLSNQLAGMSLYVDRFCGSIKELGNKLDYFNELGVNLLHLMPLFQSPEGESDGGYAVADFRKIDPRFGTLQDLVEVRKKMEDSGMYLMLDIVLNHTSHRHAWAEKAR